VLASVPALEPALAAASAVLFSTPTGLEVCSGRRTGGEGETASGREVAESRGRLERSVRIVRIVRRDVVGLARTSGRSEAIAVREADMSCRVLWDEWGMSCRYMRTKSRSG
jgi:hypothetical protein